MALVHGPVTEGFKAKLIHPSTVFALLLELPFAVSSGVLINAQHVPFAMKRSSKPTDDVVSWRRASNTSCLKCSSIAFLLINNSYYFCLSAHRFNFIYDSFLLYGFFYACLRGNRKAEDVSYHPEWMNYYLKTCFFFCFYFNHSPYPVVRFLSKPRLEPHTILSFVFSGRQSELAFIEFIGEVKKLNALCTA